MLLAVKSRGGSDFGDRVAQNLARETAREQLQPLFATACSRLAAVLHRAFDIASELQALSPGMHWHALVCLPAKAHRTPHRYCLKITFNLPSVEGMHMLSGHLYYAKDGRKSMLLCTRNF